MQILEFMRIYLRSRSPARVSHVASTLAAALVAYDSVNRAGRRPWHARARL